MIKFTLIFYSFCLVFPVLARDGMTPLMEAIDDFQTTIALDIIESGVDLDARDLKGRTALMHSVKNSTRIVTFRLLEKKANIHLLDHEKQNLLHYAIDDDETLVRRYLISRTSIDINALTIRNESPVIYGSLNYDDIAIKELALAGANLNIKTNEGKSALMISRELNDEWSVWVLLNFGAIPYLKNNDQVSYEIFMDENSWEAFSFFIDDEGNDHLIGHLKNNLMLETESFSLDYFNFERQNYHGKTALMYAVMHNQFNFIKKVLVSYKFNLNIFDYEGNTALSLARKYNLCSIVKLLEEYGAI